MTDPPFGMGATASARWAELVGLRWKAGELADLAAYCAAYGRWVDAEAFIAAYGPVMTISDDKGNVKSHGPSPQLLIAERSAKEMGRIAKELRLSARMASTATIDDAAEWLDGR